MAKQGTARTEVRWWWRQPEFLVALSLACRQVVGLVQLRRTLAWVDQLRPDHQVMEPLSGIGIHFVVPVLREQAHVPAMLSWFRQLLRELPEASLSVVTTAREDREREYILDAVMAAGSDRIALARIPQLSAEERAALGSDATASNAISRSAAAAVLGRFPTTSEVVRSELARFSDDISRIRHVHYEGGGRKAAQVNEAVMGLPEGADGGYVAVYDVDSRPTAALMERTLAFVAHRRMVTGELPAVLQQSARFETSGTHPRSWQRALCRGAAQLQTLWTLRREIPSFRRYAAAVDGRRGRRSATARGLAQTVGHGLQVRVDVFRAAGGLPVYTVLDDFPFGYRLSVDGIEVQPVPFTAVAPAPEGTVELFAQGQRWFHNYLDYPRCAQHARAAGHGTAWTRFVGLAVGAYRGATWLLRSPGMAASLALLAWRTSWATRLAAVVSLICGVVAPLRMLARAEGRAQSPAQLGCQAIELILANLVSSVGPAAAIFERARTGAPGERLSPKSSSRAFPDPTTT